MSSSGGVRLHKGEKGQGKIGPRFPGEVVRSTGPHKAIYRCHSSAQQQAIEKSTSWECWAGIRSSTATLACECLNCRFKAVISSCCGMILGFHTEIEPRSPELPELADIGMEAGRHVQERRGKRAFCAYCRQRKEDWKHKIQHGQAFGTDVTNTIPNGRGKKDTRSYRIRGSKTIWYCGTCNVAAGIFGISRLRGTRRYRRTLHRNYRS